jgi:hypothetical protein
MGCAVSELASTPRRISRRKFLAGSAGIAVAAVGTYTFSGYVDAEMYQPPAYDAAAQPELSQAATPRQPIAILVDPDASFGFYLGEVLRAEGLNAFQFENLRSIDVERLSGFGLLLLPPMQLAPEQAAALRAYVAERGGALIAMQPDQRIADLFGVRPAGGATVNGYLVDADYQAPLQIHAEAAHYALDGASVEAELFRDRTTPTGFPAVTSFEVGGGRTAMFAYDLARNIALTRQGNPAAADQERDGSDGIRANDMFVDWLDVDNLHIPQADDQARLLVRLIDHTLRDRLPMPRLWYFPGDARSLIVLTGDAHTVPATFIEDTLQTAEAYGGRASVYYTPPTDNNLVFGLRRSLSRLPLMGWLAAGPKIRPSPEEVADWRARGHEFGLHPYVEGGVDQGLVKFLRAFRRDGYAPASPTLRTHRILWSGWVESARAQAKRGFRMNVDYYHIGPVFQASDGTWPAGHFIGSGLPMKFVDERGQIVNLYQQPTQLVDEHWLASTNRGWAGLTGEQAAEIARKLIDRSIEESPAALAVQYHMDFDSRDAADYQNAHQWLTGILAHARDRGLPIWTAEHWLRFTETRHDAVFSDIHWNEDASTLSFAFETPHEPTDSLSLLLLAEFRGRQLVKIVRDDQTIAGTAASDYIQVSATAASHRFDVHYQAA